MSDFSLRLPYLIYLSIGSMLFGALIAPVFRDGPATPVPDGPAMVMNAEMAEGMHATRELPAASAPALSIGVEKDPMEGWNLTLATENFTFTPESAGGAAVPNTGHAHLYLDGVKVARLYGPHFHIPDLPPGLHEIAVSLSSNDHAYYVVEGARIEARTVIMQDG